MLNRWNETAQAHDRSLTMQAAFEARYAAAGSTMKDVVFAFDETLNKVLKKSVIWTMSQIR